MSSGRDGVIDLLNKIKFELDKQISTATKDNEINAGKIIEFSNLMPNRLMVSGLDKGTKENLISFTNLLNMDKTTIGTLKIRRQELEEILNILNP